LSPNGLRLGALVRLADAVEHLMMRQGPLGTDIVLYAVGRMAEDVLHAAENSEKDLEFVSEWIEYARWVLPGSWGRIKE
jgi:hypothetical protein